MEPNSFTKTSFCNVEIDNITTDVTKKYILNQLSILCSGMKYNSRYAKIYNEQYSKNLKNPHIFFLKSSGTPYLLFLTQINNTNYCFLIDKKMNNDKYSYPKILIVPYSFSNELYQGTLFECELIRDKNQKWSLGMNDIYYNRGKSMNRTNVIDRINTIYDIFENNYTDSEYTEHCPIFIKKFFDYKDIQYVHKEFIPKLPYNIRGIYFTPLRTDYSKILYLFPRETNTKVENKKNNKENKLNKEYKDTKEYKGKTEKKKSIVFRIMKTLKPDVYELYLKEDENLIKKGTALVQTIELSHKLFSYFENKEQVDEVKVECKYNDIFKKWVPLCLSKEEVSSIYDL